MVLAGGAGGLWVYYRAEPEGEGRCPERPSRSPEHDVVAYGDPTIYFPIAGLYGKEEFERIMDEVKSKIKEWFESGREGFQRFDLKRRYPY